MVLSVTMTPFVREYVHAALPLDCCTQFINRKVDRPDIYMHTARIRHSFNTQRDLEYLLKGTTDPEHLPCAIIFIHKKQHKAEMCSRFWDLINPTWRRLYPFLIIDLCNFLCREAPDCFARTPKRVSQVAFHYTNSRGWR